MRISDWSSDVCSSDLAGFFAYIAGSASVFISEYALSPTQFSLLFGANALGLLFAAIFNPRLHHRVGPLKAYRIMNTAYFIVLAVLMIYLMSGHSNLIILSAGQIGRAHVLNSSH